MKKIVISLLAVLTLAACGGSRTDEEKQMADQLIDAAYRTKQYGRLLTLADSLEKTGALTAAESYYWQGYASDRMMQHRTAEFYWKSAINEAIGSTDAADLSILAKSASYLANELIVREDYNEALKAAQPVAQRLESLKCDTTSDYTNLLIFIGCCQSRSGQSDEAAIACFDQAYKMHLAYIEKNRTAEVYKNAIAGIINIAYNYIGIHRYNEVLTWTDRFGKLLGEFEMRNDAQANYVDKQWMRYYIYRATALEGLNRQEEATQAYSDYQRTSYSQTPEGKMEAAEFLVAAKRWADAADCYMDLDKRFEESQTFSLEDIQKMVLKKYRTNMLAGRADTANAVAHQICDSLDASITQSRRLDAKELETIREKEAQIAEEHDATTQRRMIASFVLLAFLLACFAIYAFFHRKSLHRLTKAHKQLKSDFTQIEENASSKGRTESEQRFARDIQTKMLPTANSLRRSDLDLYASLTPSQLAGGNVYDFFVRDEKLFFCIGDAEGNGVNASLAMAIARFKFRTASVGEDLPNRIVATINKEMANNGTPVPVTLFVGVLNLQTGRLTYCNAGHCPPVLIGSGIGLLPVDQNAPVGQSTDAQFTIQEALIDPGTVIFAYTQGLTDAKDKDRRPFGQQRMMGEALQTIHGLDPTPKPFVERMTATLHRFTGDTEQDDDITMFAIRYLKKPSGGRYQRTITLPNDKNEMLRLPTFLEEVCKAMNFDKQTTEDIILTVKEAVSSMAAYAYADGTKGDIQVEAYADKAQLQFVIRDYGEPFDPTTKLKLRSINAMSYERMNLPPEIATAEKTGQNILTLTKTLNVEI